MQQTMCRKQNINGGSYMSAFIKRVEKKIYRRDVSSILSLFRNEFNKFSNTRARMLDYIYRLYLSHDIKIT